MLEFYCSLPETVQVILPSFCLLFVGVLVLQAKWAGSPPTPRPSARPSAGVEAILGVLPAGERAVLLYRSLALLGGVDYLDAHLDEAARAAANLLGRYDPSRVVPEDNLTAAIAAAKAGWRGAVAAAYRKHVDGDALAALANLLAAHPDLPAQVRASLGAVEDALAAQVDRVLDAAATKVP